MELTIMSALLMSKDLQQFSPMLESMQPLVMRGYCPDCMIEGGLVGLTFH